MATFKPMARIISHIGERLISSSKVALLELIKNSYDAKASTVIITINQNKNMLIIEDDGHGMDKETIESNWLVVGTNNRLKDKENFNLVEVPLGEKGLGRFSTMKLGNHLVLQTTSRESGEIWNLEVDWSQYGYKSNRYLDEVENSLYESKKNKSDDHFTKIIISDLNDFIGKEWTDYKILSFFSNTAAKYINPYVDLPRKFDIRVVLEDSNSNIKRWKLGQVDKKLLDQAHYEIKGSYEPNNLCIEYAVRRYGEIIEKGKDTIQFDRTIDVLDKDQQGYVGEFQFHFFVFNRSPNRLKEIKGYETLKHIREVLDRYTGGPMIFRDGFRIYPYGEHSNDWLELNKERFKSGKVKIVGVQTAGYISLDSRYTPYLVDQTNREGLIENKSYSNFKHIVSGIFDTLVMIANRNEPKQTSSNIISSAKGSALNIKNKMSEIGTDNSLNNLDIMYVINEAKKIEAGIQEIKIREKALIETSAVGMTSMQIAHELHNMIDKITASLLELKSETKNIKEVARKLEMFEINIRSLKTLISQIDEQSSTLRRAKSNIDLIEHIKKISVGMATLGEQFKIPVKINVIAHVNKLNVKVNKGLIIQLFDNLILNSFYWINNQGASDGEKHGQIDIEIFSDGVVIFSDNGPGIAKIDSEAIFDPFFSRKNGGKGLGLYISKEIAAFHNVSLELVNELNSKGKYFSFIIDFNLVRS